MSPGGQLDVDEIRRGRFPGVTISVPAGDSLLGPDQAPCGRERSWPQSGLPREPERWTERRGWTVAGGLEDPLCRSSAGIGAEAWRPARNEPWRDE